MAAAVRTARLTGLLLVSTMCRSLRVRRTALYHLLRMLATEAVGDAVVVDEVDVEESSAVEEGAVLVVVVRRMLVVPSRRSRASRLLRLRMCPRSLTIEVLGDTDIEERQGPGTGRAGGWVVPRSWWKRFNGHQESCRCKKGVDGALRKITLHWAKLPLGGTGLMKMLTRRSKSLILGFLVLVVLC